MRINKWCFSNFDKDICNFNYIKSLPFCIFSDSSDPNYPLVGNVLDSICYDRDKLVVIGEQSPPFGYHLHIDDNKVYNALLNSCQFSFVLSPLIEDTPYLIQSILAGIIPICNEEHPYIKQLGLSSYAVDVQKENILDKLVEIKYNQHIFHHKTYWLSWKYYNAVKKFRRKQNNKQKKT